MRTLLTAHSGADGTPDNSLAYVRHALSTAADALEVDVRRAPDGALVLGHDAASPVALSDVMELTAAHPSMKLNCDLKEHGLEEDAAALARSCGLAGRLVFSGEVDPDRYGCSALLRETAEVYLNLENVVPDLYLSYREIPNFELTAAEQILSVGRRCGIGTVNLYHGLLTRRMVETLAAGGMGVSAWTVDHLEELPWFFARGITNITTNRLTEALPIRDKA